jgi:hypothetical protein
VGGEKGGRGGKRGQVALDLIKFNEMMILSAGIIYDTKHQHYLIFHYFKNCMNIT